jgi:hypothetical protein
MERSCRPAEFACVRGWRCRRAWTRNCCDPARSVPASPRHNRRISTQTRLRSQRWQHGTGKDKHLVRLVPHAFAWFSLPACTARNSALRTVGAMVYLSIVLPFLSIVLPFLLSSPLPQYCLRHCHRTVFRAQQQRTAHLLEGSEGARGSMRLIRLLTRNLRREVDYRPLCLYACGGWSVGVSSWLSVSQGPLHSNCRG